MLKLPGNLTAETFLAGYWQRQPLFMRAAVARLRPSITRNELAWLATLEDVESRIVFTDRHRATLRYRAETGPFEPDYLAALPQRDWTLLVHDVEKHLPALRRLFALIPFVPDWRCDDLMISFAAPGGSVGPHQDNYDVFLCQGIGIRDWHVTTARLAPDPAASRDLALLEAFDGTLFSARAGDVLYLPPGVAHWGTARRACLTYSLGMRAPQLADLADGLAGTAPGSSFYRDPDLQCDEARPGWISDRAIARAAQQLADAGARSDDVATMLGQSVTATKPWLTPDAVEPGDARQALAALQHGTVFNLHGMARIAFDRRHAFVNGRVLPLPPGGDELVARLCAERRLRGPLADGERHAELVTSMVAAGAFDLSGIF